MGIGCKNICDHYDKVPSIHPEPKKYCTRCGYFIVTSILRCECCSNMYRIKRKYKSTGGRIMGRPKKPEIHKVHPWFDW